MTTNVILFTTHCPRCRALEIMLQKAGIEYTENSDVEYMMSLGLSNAPGLNVDGKIMNFAEAMSWVTGGQHGDR